MSTPSPWQWSAYSIHVYTRKHVRVHIAMDLTPLDPIWENVSRRSFQKKNTLNPASSHYVILSSNLSKLNLTQKNMGSVLIKNRHQLHACTPSFSSRVMRSSSGGAAVRAREAKLKWHNLWRRARTSQRQQIQPEKKWIRFEISYNPWIKEIFF